MVLKLKRNVNPSGCHPMLQSALAVALNIFTDFGVDCVVTSMCDSVHGGAHGSPSFHYFGMAADLRSKHLTEEQKDEVWRRLAQELGSDWDVVLEFRGRTQEHFHCELDSAQYNRWTYLKGLQKEFLRDSGLGAP